MKQNRTGSAVLLGAVIVLFAGALAQAQTTTYPTTTPPTTSSVLSASAAPAPTAPMPAEILTVDSAGNILLRGIVVSTSTNAITINSWGGTWTIQTSPATQVISSGTTNNNNADISSIAAGDFIGAIGTVGSGGPWTVNATLVHDWTSAPQAGSNTTTTGTTTGSADTTSPPAGDSLYTGAVADISSIANDTFTINESGGATATVTVSPGATIWDASRSVIPLSSIAQNDSVRIDGQLQTDGSINADVVRDTSK